MTYAALWQSARSTWPGFADVLVPDWMSQDDIDKLNAYPYDPDKGAQMLTDLGWKKGSDTSG